MKTTYTFVKYQRQTDEKRRSCISERLTQWIDFTGVSAYELGKRCHTVGQITGQSFGVTDIHAYLSGRCCPKIDRLVILADVMGVTVAWLTGYSNAVDKRRIKAIVKAERREKK